MMLYGTIQMLPETLFKDVSKQLELSIGFLREMGDQKVTHLICPTFPVAAPEHRKIKDIILGAFWTGLFNFVGNPSCVVPVGTVESLSKSNALCSKDKSDPYLNRVPKSDKNGLYFDEYTDDVGDFITRLFDKECKKGNTNNLPIGIQVVGKLWEDEQTIGLAKFIQKEMGIVTIGEKLLV